jgi:hypothetical protein
MVIVGLATITAAVIYIFSEGLLEEGFESLSYESRTVINNLFGEQEADSGLFGVREGGRMETEVKAGDADDKAIQIDQARRREEGRARRAERARRAVEKLHRTQGKNVIVANVGIGNAWFANIKSGRMKQSWKDSRGLKF